MLLHHILLNFRHPLLFWYTTQLWPLKSRMLHKIIPISRWLINKPSLHLLTLRLSQLGLLVTYHSLNGVSWSKSTSPLIKKSRLKTKYSAVQTNKLIDQNYRFILSLYLGYNVTLNVAYYSNAKVPTFLTKMYVPWK